MGMKKWILWHFFDVRALKWLQNGPEEYRSGTRGQHGEIREDSIAAPQKVRYQYMAKK